jgi:enoyl-CoA hydratase
VLLPRRIGYGPAAELLFGGEPIDANRALVLGVVQHVVPDPDLEECAWSLAERIARHSAAALRATKRTLVQTAARPREEAMRKAGEVYLDELMSCADPVEGLQAFLAKRAPVWRHR